MFRHVVMFRWKPDTSADTIEGVRAGLAGLPAKIPEIVEYRFGPDAGLGEGNWDFGVVADFSDEAGYVLYRDHPDHQELIDKMIRPAISDRAALQYIVV